MRSQSLQSMRFILLPAYLKIIRLAQSVLHVVITLPVQNRDRQGAAEATTYLITFVCYGAWLPGQTASQYFEHFVQLGVNPVSQFDAALGNPPPDFKDVAVGLGREEIASHDHASRLLNIGSKMGVTPRTRPWPDVSRMSPDVKSRVDELWNGRKPGCSRERAETVQPALFSPARIACLSTVW
jgi:hypothetical protein